jgi:hypothetical protein
MSTIEAAFRSNRRVKPVTTSFVLEKRITEHLPFELSPCSLLYDSLGNMTAIVTSLRHESNPSKGYFFVAKGISTILLIHCPSVPEKEQPIFFSRQSGIRMDRLRKT